jgi:hypothetical protein
MVQFASAVPKELEKVIEADKFSSTVATLNDLFESAERVTCASVGEVP